MSSEEGDKNNITKKNSVSEEDELAEGTEFYQDEDEVNNDVVNDGSEISELEETDFDDEDEEDDDDDDEDDDEEAAVKHNKSRKRTARNRFIVEEAEEESGSDDSDVGESGLKEHERQILQQQRLRDRARARRIEERADIIFKTGNEEMIQKFAERHIGGNRGVNDTYDDVDQIAIQDSGMFRKRLLPTVNDPNVWMVKCRIGDESNAVFSLTRKFIYLRKQKEPLLILSAYHQTGIKGYIYIESHKQTYVKQFGNNSPNMVPLNEMPDTLKIIKETLIIQPKTWVRIKNGIYKNALAKVIVSLFKRVDPRKLKDDDGAPNSNYSYSMSNLSEELITKSFQMNNILINEIKPKVEELEMFEKWTTDEDTIVHKFNIKEEPKKFRIGEKVRVISGELASLTGKIVSIQGDIINVEPKHEELKNVIQLVARDLEKHFDTGDTVTIIDGFYKDSHGTVIRVVNPREKNNLSNSNIGKKNMWTAFILLDVIKKEVEVPLEYLTMFTKMTSGTDKTCKFRIGDFVRLDSVTVGYILEINGDVAEVINNHNKTNSHNVKSLTRYVPRYSVNRDKNRFPIHVGDTVSVVTNNNTDAKQSGQILVFWKDSAFIKSTTFSMHNPIFAIGTRSLVSNSIDSGVNFVPVHMNENEAINTGHMSPRVYSNGENFKPQTAMNTQKIREQMKNFKEIKGATVRIMSGLYKGQYGIVKSATANDVRIELHSSNKTVSVKHNEIAKEGSEDSILSDVRSATNTPKTPGDGVSAASGVFTQSPWMRSNQSYSGGGISGRTPHIGGYDGTITPASRSSHGISYQPTPSHDGNRTPFNSTVFPYRDHHTDGFPSSGDYSSNSKTGLKLKEDEEEDWDSFKSTIPSSHVSDLNFPLTKGVEVSFFDKNKNIQRVGKILNVFNDIYQIQPYDDNKQSVSLPKTAVFITNPSIGDNVKVVVGENNGSIGKIINITESECTVESSDGTKTTFIVPLVNVAKFTAI